MPFLNPVVVVLGIFALLMVARAVVVVPENYRGGVVRLGRYLKTLGPGLHVSIPFIDLVTKVDLGARIPGWQGLSERDLNQAVESFVTLGPVTRTNTRVGSPGPISQTSPGSSEADRLAGWLVKTAGDQLGVDLSNDPLAKNRIGERALTAVEELRSSGSCDIHLPFLTADRSGPKHFELSLTRSKLNEILGSKDR